METTTKKVSELALNDQIKLKIRGRLCQARVCLRPSRVESGSIKFGARTSTGKLYVRRANPDATVPYLGQAPRRPRTRRQRRSGFPAHVG